MTHPCVRSPPSLRRGTRGLLDRCRGGIGESTCHEDFVGRDDHAYLGRDPSPPVPSPEGGPRGLLETEGFEEASRGVVVLRDRGKGPCCACRAEALDGARDEGPSRAPSAPGRVHRDEIDVAYRGRTREDDALEESHDRAPVLDRKTS